MSKSKKQDAPPPRPEAAPLPFKRLTAAQRKAGEAIATTLHRMANERGPSTFASAQEHPYLPHIDGRRSNRVLLIDGGRGTGKSTLVVTLLKGYGQLVLGQEPPEEFEEMDDRIIPIGIVDLQPLPPQTNLALHIAGHLKRVVEAVDPPPTAVSENFPPLWDEQSLSQLRERWKRLMKLLATWDESLEARLGRPDMSAYVVETIEEELERGQLPERFREAVDVLVEDYARRFRWSGRKRPLFLLAIDDADMNPRLSVKLLELLRKLWHPRLAFLVAGDSELFLLRLREALYAQGSRAAREQEYYYKLAEDIYAKDIPSSARFRLDSLLPEERVKRLSEIRKLLKQYTVEVHPPELPRDYPTRPPTLRDYLLVNEQSTELLPGRLRQIDELTTRLRGEVDVEKMGAPSSAALRVIKWLWDQTVKEHFGKDEHQRQLIDAVRSSRLDGRLRLDMQKVRLRSELEPAAKIKVGDRGSTINLQDLNRFQAFANLERYSLDSDLGSTDLEKSLTACWLLATDVAADAVHDSRLDETTTPFAEGSLQFVVASWRDPNSNAATLTVPWMLPAWNAPVDYVLFAQHWRELLNSNQSQRTQDVGLIARQFLWLAIQIAKSRTVSSQKNAWWENVSDWPAITEEVAKLADLSNAASPRQQANAQWAIEKAVLIAAPEACLPLEEARSFFENLKKRLGTLWSASRIQEKRLALVTQSNRSKSDREGLLDDIDASNPSHPFVQAWKSPNELRNRGGDVTDLWNTIGRLEASHLKTFTKEDGKLDHYRTELRQRALGNLPKAISSAAGLEIERHQRISESTRAPVVLVGLWRAFAEKMARHDIADWFSLHRTRITISKEAMDFGEELRKSILTGRERGVQTITIDAVRTLCIERFAPVHRASNLPASIDALFRVIFDYFQDQDDASAISTELLDLSLWPLVSTQLHSGAKNPLHTWPMVRWPSLKEYESFVKDWSDTVHNLEGWLELDEAKHKPYAADSLALSYLQNCTASRWRQGRSYYVESNATEAKFAELLKTLVEQSKAQGGRRDKLFSRWIESLPLMGTPEAALSDHIAQVFIDHAFSTGMEHTRLRQLRRERALADGVLAGEVEALLAKIDQPIPEHPWVKKVEARDPSDDGAPSRKEPRS